MRTRWLPRCGSRTGDNSTRPLQLKLAWRPEPSPVQMIRLLPRNTGNGGTRWLAKCPVCEERRAVYLYVPPGRDRLMCRECGGLLYRTSQRSDPRISRMRNDPELLETTLQSQNPRANLIGLDVLWEALERSDLRRGRRDPKRMMKAVRLLDPWLAEEIEARGGPRSLPRARRARSSRGGHTGGVAASPVSGSPRTLVLPRVTPEPALLLSPLRGQV